MAFRLHVFHVPFYEYSVALSFGVTNTRHAEVFPFSAFAIASSPYTVVRDLISAMV